MILLLYTTNATTKTTVAAIHEDIATGKVQVEALIAGYHARPVSASRAYTNGRTLENAPRPC